MSAPPRRSSRLQAKEDERKKTEQRSSSHRDLTPPPYEREGSQNSIVVFLGACDTDQPMTEGDVTAVQRLISKAKVLLVQLETSAAVSLAALRLARKHGVTTIFKPAPGLSDLDPALIAASDYIIPNESEAELLTGIIVSDIKAAETAAIKIRQILRGASTVIVTLGEKGVVLLPKGSEKSEHLRCPVVKVDDTSGAGDAFVGSFAYFLTKRSELPLKEQVRRSMLVASYSVTKRGTQESYPTQEELPSRIMA